MKTYVPRPNEIELHSGLFLELTNPHCHDYTLQEIAWGLSHNTRFTGQASRMYTVAEHAVLVARRLQQLGEPLMIQLGGLHHDDAEAFLGDVNRGLKSLLPDYRAIEHRVQNAIMRALGIEPTVCEDSRVKQADHWALAAEARYLMPSGGKGWFCEGEYNPEDSDQWKLATSVIASRKKNYYHEFLFEHGRITDELER